MFTPPFEEKQNTNPQTTWPTRMGNFTGKTGKQHRQDVYEHIAYQDEGYGAYETSSKREEGTDKSRKNATNLRVGEQPTQILQRSVLPPFPPEAPPKELHRAIVQVVAASHHG